MPESPKVVRELNEVIFDELRQLRCLEEMVSTCGQDDVDAAIKKSKKRITELRIIRINLEELLAQT